MSTTTIETCWVADVHAVVPDPKGAGEIHLVPGDRLTLSIPIKWSEDDVRPLYGEGKTLRQLKVSDVEADLKSRIADLERQKAKAEKHPVKFAFQTMIKRLKQK